MVGSLLPAAPRGTLTGHVEQHVALPLLSAAACLQRTDLAGLAVIQAVPHAAACTPAVSGRRGAGKQGV